MLSRYVGFYAKDVKFMKFDLDVEITTRIICDADYGHKCNLARKMFTIQDMIDMAGAEKWQAN